MKNEYKHIKKRVQVKKEYIYLEFKNRYDRTREEFYKKYQKITKIYNQLTAPYKKTRETIQHIIKELSILHQKTLVAGIVKIVFLFRKHFKK